MHRPQHDDERNVIRETVVRRRPASLLLALDLDPSGTGSTGVPGACHHNLARNYLQQNMFEEALQLANQAVSLCPIGSRYHEKFIKLKEHLALVLEDPYLCDALNNLIGA